MKNNKEYICQCLIIQYVMDDTYSKRMCVMPSVLCIEFDTLPVVDKFKFIDNGFNNAMIPQWSELYMTLHKT